MDLKTIIETENHITRTTLLGNNFEISADRNIYNAIRGKYKTLAQTAQSKFAEMDSQFTDINDLTRNAPNAFVVAIEDSLKELLQDIISVGVYTIDKDLVIERAFEENYFNEFNEGFEKINSQYEKIFQELSDAEFYREMRKESRPRWQSATFGGNAVDAWCDQFETGVMNLAEGAGHAVVNWIGNQVSRTKAKKELANLFNRKSLRQNMIDSVYDSCFNLHFLLIDIVKSNTNIDFNGTISEFDKQKAAAMFNNFTTISLSEDKKAIFVNEIFQLNPYERDYYAYILTKFGDSDNALGNFAQFFSINSFDIKNDILAEYAEDNLGETENEANDCRVKVDEYAKKIGLETKYITTAYSIINEQLEKIDLEYRTVDEVVFETREIADEARNELVKIQEIMEDVKPPTKDSTLSYENRLKEKKQQLEELKTNVNLKYIGLVNEYMDKFDRLFTNKDGFGKTLTRAEKGQQLALSFVKNFSITSYEELDRAKTMLIAYLPETGITLEQATSANQYIQTHENRLNIVDGVVFDSREGAVKGRQELEEIAGIMSTVLPPENDALLDYERNILNIKNQVEQFQTDVKLKYLSILQQHLKKFDEKFRKISLLKVAATREEAAMDKALKFVKSRTYQNLTDVENVYNDLVALLPNLGIEIEQAVEATDYLASVKNKLEGGKSSGFMKLFKK